MIKEKQNKGSKTVLKSLLEEITPLEMKKSRDLMKLAARIDKLLVERGLSKIQFAKFMGKEASTISKWLSGTHNFTVDTLSEISDCLGVNLNQLFAEKPQQVVFKSQFNIGSVNSVASRFYHGAYPPYIYPVFAVEGGPVWNFEQYSPENENQISNSNLEELIQKRNTFISRNLTNLTKLVDIKSDDKLQYDQKSLKV
jgi:transcriptional regulator with XRE-family HTH domain